MVWSTCTIIKDKVLSKVKDVSVDNTEEDFALLRFVVPPVFVVLYSVIIVLYSVLVVLYSIFVVL